MNRQSPDYGRGTAEIEEDEPQQSRSEVLDRLRSVLAAPGFRPPMLPSVALEVLALSRRADVSVQDIRAVLERDSLLAGEVLKLARSARYAAQTPVRRLNDAIVRIGIAGLRNLVLEAATRLTVFRAGAYTEVAESVRRHSAAVARLARAVAQFSSVDAEFAFLLGLTHDIGLVTAMMALGTKASATPGKLTLVEWQACESIHEALSAQLAESWGLPPEVAWVLKSHHTFERDAKAQHPAIAVLAAAEHLADVNGFSPKPVFAGVDALTAVTLSDQRPVEQFKMACEQLRLSEQVRQQLIHGAKACIADEQAAA